MNINKTATAAILTILSFVLFIYPNPDGILYDISDGIVFLLIVIVLYYFAVSENIPNPLGEKKFTNPPNHETPQWLIDESIVDQYKELLSVSFNLINSIDENYHPAFFMVGNSGQQLNIQFSQNSIFKKSIAINQNIIKTILSQNESVLFQQSKYRNDWNDLFIEKTWRGSECILGTKIVYNDMPVGCIIVQTDHFSNIHKKDIKIISSLGHFISFGMMKLDKIEKLTLDKYFNSQITDLLNSLDIRSEVRGLYEKIRDLCRIFFSYDKLTISELQKDKNHFKIVIEDGFTGDIDLEKFYPLQGIIFGQMFCSDTPIISADIKSDFIESGRLEENDLNKYKFDSLLSVPVFVNKKIKFRITLEKMKSGAFKHSEINLLELLGMPFGSIVTWQQQYLHMRDDALHDGLTQLLNHNAFMDRFGEEISRAERYQHSVVLAMLDLDKFKRINDSYGHLYGDYVIKEVSRIIRDNVRTIDIVGRYGGEEFAIILINTNIERIITVAQRIIEKIASFSFNFDNIDVRMTISCGLSEYPKDANSIKGLFSKADESMYVSKKHGGNLVTVYEKNPTNPSDQTINY